MAFWCICSSAHMQLYLHCFALPSDAETSAVSQHGMYISATVAYDWWIDSDMRWLR